MAFTSCTTFCTNLQSEGWLYLVPAPALQGCMAWGTIPAETLWELPDVARMLIELRKEKGEPLPEEREG